MGNHNETFRKNYYHARCKSTHDIPFNNVKKTAIGESVDIFNLSTRGIEEALNNLQEKYPEVLLNAETARVKKLDAFYIPYITTSIAKIMKFALVSLYAVTQ